MSNRFFYWALIISCLVHITAVISLSIAKLKVKQKKKVPLEVTYYALPKPSTQQKPLKFKDLKISPKNFPSKRVKINSKEEPIFSPSGRDIKDISKIPKKHKISKKLIPKITAADAQRKISVPLLKSEKMTNAKYLSYNQTIRQKIEMRAYSFNDHPQLESGEVYLTFILSSNGRMKDIHIIEDRTTASTAVKSIGLRCVKESSPFPPFPKDLIFPELTFNILIKFQVN